MGTEGIPVELMKAKVLSEVQNEGILVKQLFIKMGEVFVIVLKELLNC
jgi:hypothetical protein